MPSGYRPRKSLDERNERSMAIIKSILEDNEIDARLTPGQLHAAVVESLGCEPIVFVANLLAMSIHARSKITIAPAEACKIGLAVMDRLYGPPDVKIRRASVDENQFELEFAWAGKDSETVLIPPGEPGAI
jgi:hypothetical protein